MKKKGISKKTFKVVKNRVLEKKNEKKKAKYFCRKKFGVKNVLEYPPPPRENKEFCFLRRGGELFGKFRNSPNNVLTS